MEASVHALWVDSRLALWAEDLARPTAAPVRRGRPPKNPRARPHPFTAASADLASVLAPWAAEAEHGILTLSLPGTAAGPAPSHISAEDDGTRVQWQVPALVFPAGRATELLESLALADDASPTVRWLAAAAEFAADLAARGRLLPALVEERRGWAARWRPVLTTADAERAKALARSMPGAVTAATDPGAVPPPLETLRDIVNGVADATCRAALTGVRLGRQRGAPRSAAEAFASALATDDGYVQGPHAAPGQLAKLATILDEWRASAAPQQGPVRLCLRLEPPPEPEDEPEDTEAHGAVSATTATTATTAGGAGETWRIEFLLQATEDPTLLVPAAQVWAGDVAPLRSALAGRHPFEVLLAGMGRASRVYPPLEAALAAARPDAMEVGTARVAEFLRDGVPLLDQAGFGVLVPRWLSAGRSRLKARVKATSGPAATTVGGVGLDALVDYHWEIALGDDTLTAEELRDLARLKQPLVRVRGKWVELREDDVAAAVRLVEQGPRRRPAGDVLRTALGLSTDAADLPVDGVEADGWLGKLLAGGGPHATHRRSPRTPKGFAGTLRPYQRRGLAWLSFLGDLGLGACLADDMGLGKTAQLLAVLVADPSRNGPTLVVCPMSVVGNWQRECARFAPALAVHVHHGTGRLTGAEFAAEAAQADVVLTTYALAARDRDLLASVAWDRIALDEAQNVKNSGARQTTAVRSLPARRRVALTGTPVENRLTELWSIMQFLNPGLLGSERAFRERFAIPIERHGNDEAAELLRRVTGPFVLRRLKTDKRIIADLPEKLEMKVYCNLTREQATLYQAVVDDMLEKIAATEGTERRGLVLATLLKLKQVCNHPAQLLRDGSPLAGRSGKLARLVETLEEVIAEGDRALVFTQFAEMGTMLVDHLPACVGREVLFLHGGVAKKGRDELVDRFQSDDGPSVFLLSLKAGGVGLNLTAANHVVHFDRWWNPAVEDQATDRAFRIGQRRNVQVRKLVCVGTLEERIDEMIETKRALAERIVGTGEAWLTELSTDALREVIALSADAVAEG